MNEQDVNTITREEAARLMQAATPGPCPKCRGRGYIAGYPRDSQLCADCNATGERIVSGDLYQLAHTVVALHDRIAELEATLAAERGDPAGALPGWRRIRPGAWRRDLGDGVYLIVQFAMRSDTLEAGHCWWMMREAPGGNDKVLASLNSWSIDTAREAMRAADAALKARALIVEPATACPNDASRAAVCADPESCAKHGCGYLESLNEEVARG